MSKRIALVIGNNDYKYSPLANPKNDAIAMTEKLSELGFDVISAIDLLNHRTLEILNNFNDKISDADVALFFYAGHGLQVEDKNYLVPVDAEIHTVADLDSQTIKLDTLLKIMTAPERASLIFLDACRDNPLPEEDMRSLSGNGTRSFGISRGLAKIEKVSGTCIVYATAPGDVALDGKGENSPFTSALLKHIGTKGISIGDMLLRVRDTVYQETKQRQEPWELTSLRSRFCFVEELEEASNKPDGFSEIQSGVSKQGLSKIIYMPEHEPRYWQEVASSENPKALEDFLEKYPDGQFAYIAIPKLLAIRKKLKDKQEAQEKLTDIEKLEEEAGRHWSHIKDLPDQEVLLEFARRYRKTSYYKKASTTLLKSGVVISNNGPNDLVEILQPSSGKTGWFQEELFMPQMVLIPSGSYMMGVSEDDKNVIDNEIPLHKVVIEKSFAIGRFSVTFEQWDYFIKENNIAHSPKDQGWGHGKLPVINVSWEQAKAYVKWLSETSGSKYRLPSEAEWEYVARAGTETEYWWGNEISLEQANYSGGAGGTMPVDSFNPNPWGLYNIHGNVLEWCEDQLHQSYEGAPTDGSAWISSNENAKATFRILRGGAWNSNASLLRTRRRHQLRQDFANFTVGFRVARDF